VILIIGILAAIAIPALLGQKSKAYDSSAKTLAQTAQSTAETYATENNGLYSFTEAKQLNAIEPSINYKNTKEAELTVAKGIEVNVGYEVMTTAQTTGDKYTSAQDDRQTSAFGHPCETTAGWFSLKPAAEKIHCQATVGRLWFV